MAKGSRFRDVGSAIREEVIEKPTEAIIQAMPVEKKKKKPTAIIMALILILGGVWLLTQSTMVNTAHINYSIHVPVIEDIIIKIDQLEINNAEVTEIKQHQRPYSFMPWDYFMKKMTEKDFQVEVYAINSNLGKVVGKNSQKVTASGLQGDYTAGIRVDYPTENEIGDVEFQILLRNKGGEIVDSYTIR